MQLATLLQMTYPGAPVVYYGDEIALRGTEAYDEPHQDADARWAFPWHDRDSWDKEMLAYFKEAVALRHAHRALRRGHFFQLYAEDGVYAFARRDDVETLVVVLNVADEPHQAALPVGAYFADEVALQTIFGQATADLLMTGRLR